MVADKSASDRKKKAKKKRAPEGARLMLAPVVAESALFLAA
jgi:hypothetical protein